MDINESADSPTRRRSLPHSTTHATWDSISWEQQGRLVTKVQRRKALLPYLPHPPGSKKKGAWGRVPAPKSPQPRRGSQGQRSMDLIPPSARISTILGPGIQHFLMMRHTMLYLTCRFRSRAWEVLSPPGTTALSMPLHASPLPALTTTRSAGCIRIIANEMRLFCSLHS